MARNKGQNCSYKRHDYDEICTECGEQVEIWERINGKAYCGPHRPKNMSNCDECGGRESKKDLFLFRKKHLCRDCLVPDYEPSYQRAYTSSLAHTETFGDKTERDINVGGLNRHLAEKMKENGWPSMAFHSGAIVPSDACARKIKRRDKEFKEAMEK